MCMFQIRFMQAIVGKSDRIQCQSCDCECFSCLLTITVYALLLSASCSGVLRMQKFRTPLLVGAQGYQRFPLFKHRVGI